MGTRVLTQLQSQLLSFIIAYGEKNAGTSPTFEEMRTELGVSSKSSVARIINALEERGFIRRLPGRVRNIEVIRAHAGIGLSAFSTEVLVAELGARGLRVVIEPRTDRTNSDAP